MVSWGLEEEFWTYLGYFEKKNYQNRLKLEVMPKLVRLSLGKFFKLMHINFKNFQNISNAIVSKCGIIVHALVWALF